MKLKTHIDGFDEILKGGLLKPSAVLVAGPAGSGKTTFCLQSLFNAAKNGESCIFISMLVESPSMIIRNLSQYSFFDNSVIESGNLRILSIGAGIIEKGDFAIFEFINDVIDKYKPSRVTIDPITILDHITSTFEEKELQNPQKRSFVINLFSEFEEWNIMLMITGEMSENSIANSPWAYMVDGIVILGQEYCANNIRRCLNVTKMRGTDFLNGKHTFKMTSDGITVFPRFMPIPVTSDIKSGNVSTGVKDLDEMLGNGLLQTSATMIASSAGCGKTMLSLQFITNGVLNNEPCLMISFEDNLKELAKSVSGFGLDLEQYHTEDLLRYIYCPQGEICPDELAIQIKIIVDEIGVKRILIDSISGLKNAIPDPKQLETYIFSLIKYFKNNNITSIFTYELPEVLGDVKIPDSGLPFIMDSTIIMKNIEIDGQIKKSIYVLKMRGSKADNTIKEFIISDRGFEIRDLFAESDELMCECTTTEK